MTRYTESTVASEKSTLLSSLGCTKEVWLLNRYFFLLKILLSLGKGSIKNDRRNSGGTLRQKEKRRKRRRKNEKKEKKEKKEKNQKKEKKGKKEISMVDSSG